MVRVRVRIYYQAADGYLREMVAEIGADAGPASIAALLPPGARFRYAVAA